MVQLTIAQINVELNYLEENYQRLTIKTIEYKIETIRLVDMTTKLLSLDDQEFAVIETQQKNYITSTLKNKFMTSNGPATQQNRRVTVDED